MVISKFFLFRRVIRPDFLVILKDQFRRLQSLTVFRHIGYVDVALLNFWILGVDINHVQSLPTNDFPIRCRRVQPHPAKSVSSKCLLWRRVSFPFWGISLHGCLFTTRQGVALFIHVNHVNRALNLFVLIDDVEGLISFHRSVCRGRCFGHPDKPVALRRKVLHLGSVSRTGISCHHWRNFTTRGNVLARRLVNVANVDRTLLDLFVFVNYVVLAFRH